MNMEKNWNKTTKPLKAVIKRHHQEIVSQLISHS